MVDPTSVKTDPSLSFADPELRACPFAAYDQLREECPVYRDPVTGFYVLTRFADVKKALLNHAALSNRTGLITSRDSSVAAQVEAMFAEQGWPQRDTLVTNDPPSHRMYRALVERAFDALKVAKLEEYIARTCDELIDAFAAEGRVEFVSRFAERLPVMVIADQLGVPIEDLAKFRRWSDATVEVIDPGIDPARELEITGDLIAMQHYFADRIEHARRSPDDKLLSQLVHAEVDGRGLDQSELVSLMQQLLVAGNETTVAALTHGVKRMIENPEARAAMIADNSLIPQFVEEVLRLDSPIQGLFRKTKAEISIGDTVIPAGAIVQVQYGAANRDADVFSDPDHLDLDRDNVKKHLAFGAGIHLCIGNQLARAELRIAFQAVLQRLHNLRFAPGETFSSGNSFVAYALSRLNVEFDSAAPKQG